MGKFLQLNIADPCHEDWNKMTDNEKGKFCGVCQKQVIDFSGMTDTQLVAFFKKRSADAVCGRFNDDQLDRVLAVPQKRIPWMKYLFQFTLPIFLTSLKAKAQGMVIVKTTQTEIGGQRGDRNASLKEGMSDLLVDEGVQIKGIVLNEHGQPVPFASIEKGIVGTAADSAGAFSLVLAANANGIKLNISSAGYESKEILISREQQRSVEPIVIKLKSKGLLNEVVINSSSRWSTGLTIITSTTRSWWLPKPFPGTVPFKVYSNPTTANSTIYIKPEKPEAGSYSIQLFNLSGQLIKQEAVNIEKGKGAISFSIPAITPGTYIVTLLNQKTGKKYSQKIIVQ